MNERIWMSETRIASKKTMPWHFCRTIATTIFIGYFIYDANIQKHYLMFFFPSHTVHNDTLLVYSRACHSFNHTIGMLPTCFHNNHIKYLRIKWKPTRQDMNALRNIRHLNVIQKRTDEMRYTNYVQLLWMRWTYHMCDEVEMKIDIFVHFSFSLTFLSLHSCSEFNKLE